MASTGAVYTNAAPPAATAAGGAPKQSGLSNGTSRRSMSAIDTRSTRKEASPVKVNKSRNEKFHRLFKSVPEEEMVIKSFSCAYLGDILLQGYLYISPNWFCFYSKILGHEKQIEIPVGSVLNLTREKTAFIIPNAIGILTPKDKYVFGSLMSRDNAYRLMSNVLKKIKTGASEKDEEEEEEDDGSEFSDANADVVDSNNVFLSSKPEIQLDANSSSDSECSSGISVCTECGTPLTEHEQGECDNAPVDDQVRVTSAQSLQSWASNSSGRGTSTSPSSPSSPINMSSSSGCVPNGTATGASSADTFHKQGNVFSWRCLGYKRTRKALHHIALRIQRMPRTSLLLLVCGILAFFLVGSAVILAYKIVLLQAQLDSSLGWLDPDTSKHLHSQKVYSDIYYLNQQYHTSTVERLHSVLEANIHLLGQVYQSLESLNRSPYASPASKTCSDVEPPGAQAASSNGNS